MDTAVEQASRRRMAWRARSRRFVHLGLLATLGGAVGTLQLLHIRDAIHAGVGLAFALLVVVHLGQRRYRITRMLTQLVRVRSRLEREVRLFSSDAILAFIAANVVVSGILDWGRGAPLLLPLPRPLDRWHLTSSLVLIIYVIVHVWRRRKRLLRSTIR